MSEAQHTTSPGESLTPRTRCWPRSTPSHQVAHPVEIDKLDLAIQWAVMHPVESINHGAATVDGTEGELAIAGPGAPLVAEFCVADLAFALGMSTDAGRTYLGDALELRYRLPKLWAAVTTGTGAGVEGTEDRPGHQDPVPRRRRPRRHPPGPPGAPVLVRADRPRRRRRPAAVRPRRGREAPPRSRRRAALRRRPQQVSFDGTVHVDAELDLADALDLNDAITAGAPQLANLGCEESLDVRRSLAAGALARRELTLDLQTDQRPSRPAPREAGADDLRPPRRRPAVAGVENTRSAISVEQVKDWCKGTNTHVTIRPVIDLNDQPAHRRLPAHRDHARASDPDQRHLRLPALHPTITNSRPRPPRGVRRHQHRQHQPRTTLPGPPPLQDPRRLDRRPHRTHHLHLDQHLRLHLRLGHPATPDIPTDITPPAPPAGPQPCPGTIQGVFLGR